MPKESVKKSEVISKNIGTMQVNNCTTKIFFLSKKKIELIYNKLSHERNNLPCIVYCIVQQDYKFLKYGLKF